MIEEVLDRHCGFLRLREAQRYSAQSVLVDTLFTYEDLQSYRAVQQGGMSSEIAPLLTHGP